MRKKIENNVRKDFVLKNVSVFEAVEVFFRNVKL